MRDVSDAELQGLGGLINAVLALQGERLEFGAAGAVSGPTLARELGRRCSVPPVLYPPGLGARSRDARQGARAIAGALPASRGKQGVIR